MENPAKQPLTYHRIIEAMKFAFGEKAREGDPKFYQDYEKSVSVSRPAGTERCFNVQITLYGHCER